MLERLWSERSSRRGLSWIRSRPATFCREDISRVVTELFPKNLTSLLASLRFAILMLAISLFDICSAPLAFCSASRDMTIPEPLFVMLNAEFKRDRDDRSSFSRRLLELILKLPLIVSRIGASIF